MPYNLRNGQYPYPLNYLSSDGGLVSEDFVSNDPAVEVGSNNWYVVCLTPDELLDLQSVIAVGAPIAIPENYNTIIQKYSQMREYPNEIPEDSCMDFCQLVLDCIETNQAVQDAIALQSETDGDAIINSGVWKDENFSAVNGGICDDDVLYGMIDGVITYLNSKMEDWIENFEVATNVIEFADAVSSLPIIGVIAEGIGVTGALEYIEFLFDSLAENYQAQYTVELRDDLECELFCWVKENNVCEFSITDIAQFYAEKAGTSFGSINTLIDLANFLVLGVWSGAGFVYAGHLMIAGALALDKVVAGRQFESFKRAVLIAPPSIEHTFCPACNICTSWDFSIDEQGFVGADLGGPYEPRAVYVLSTAWASNPLELRGQVIIERFFTGTIEGITINLNTNMTDSGYAGSGRWFYKIDDAVSVQDYEIGVDTHTFTFPEVAVVTKVACGIIWHSAISPSYPLAPQRIISVEFCD